MMKFEINKNLKIEFDDESQNCDTQNITLSIFVKD